MRFRSKSVEIEANQFFHGATAPIGVRVREDGSCYVITIHGQETDVASGDWIILEPVKCQRCDGDGYAHGSDRPFEWSGPGTYPGRCPVCTGSGMVPGDGQRAYPCKPDVFEKRYESLLVFEKPSI